MLLDVEPSEQDAAKCAVVLRGDATAAAGQLLEALRGSSKGGALLPGAADWAGALQSKVAAARQKLSAKLSKTAFPLDYHTTMRVIRDELSALSIPAVVVSEGANTMDNARWVACLCCCAWGAAAAVSSAWGRARQWPASQPLSGQPQHPPQHAFPLLAHPVLIHPICRPTLSICPPARLAGCCWSR